MTNHASSNRVAVVTAVFELALTDDDTAEDLARYVENRIGRFLLDENDRVHIDSFRETVRRA